MQLIKVNRIAAWILLVTILLYFISGYGMTKGIIDKQLAVALHQNILPFITITAFIIHVSTSVKFALMRWRAWNNFTKAITIFIFLTCYLLFLYFQFFYQLPISTKANLSPNKTINQNDNQQTQKIFTTSELAKYNGQNGNPAYAAVDGVIYDLTNVFKDGEHFGHIAGQDLTNAFYIKHVKSQIEKYPVVGILK